MSNAGCLSTTLQNLCETMAKIRMNCCMHDPLKNKSVIPYGVHDPLKKQKYALYCAAEHAVADCVDCIRFEIKKAA